VLIAAEVKTAMRRGDGDYAAGATTVSEED
jgi:hypothetical protein